MPGRGAGKPTLVSSVDAGDGDIGVIHVDGDVAWFARHACLARAPRGTGDLLTAAFAAALVERLPPDQALLIATGVVADAVAHAEWRDGELRLMDFRPSSSRPGGSPWSRWTADKSARSSPHPRSGGNTARTLVLVASWGALRPLKSLQAIGRSRGLSDPRASAGSRRPLLRCERGGGAWLGQRFFAPAALPRSWASWAIWTAFSAAFRAGYRPPPTLPGRSRPSGLCGSGLTGDRELALGLLR